MEATDLIGDVTGEMPEVQEHAIAAAQEDDEAQERAASNAVDRDGNPFDPAMHETDGEGNPVLTKAGSLRKKRGGKGKSKLGTPEDASPNSAQFRAVAETTAMALFTTGRAIGGEEWSPIVSPKEGIDEHKQMVDAWEAYYKAKGVTDIPPGLAVTVAMVGYAAPRFFMPKTQSRWQRAKEAVQRWYLNRKSKKEPVTTEE